MIESTTGNLLHAEVEALVNTVNCVGIMGKGIALQFKQAFPETYKTYRRACESGEVRLGQMHIWPNHALTGPKYIINFPTKQHWRSKSRLADIEAGLLDLADKVRMLNIQSIAIPPLGCGYGGLDWKIVRPNIIAAFDEQPDVQAFLFEPTAEPWGVARRMPPNQPKLTTPRALFLRLLSLYSIPEYSLTQLEVQKLAYFLQVAGQALQLSFRKHTYGPYAHNLNHVLRVLEGHYIHGAINTSPHTELTLVDGANEDAESFLMGDLEANDRLVRVAQLIEGFETPYGMELLATVHWVAQEDTIAAKDIDRCIQQIHQWNERKRRVLRPEHIKVAHEALTEQGWLA